MRLPLIMLTAGVIATVSGGAIPAGSWTRVADMQTGRSAHAVTATDRASTCSQVRVLMASQSPRLSVSTERRGLQKLALLGEGLNAPAAAALGNVIYLIGAVGTTTSPVGGGATLRHRHEDVERCPAASGAARRARRGEEDADRLARFELEAKLVAALNHPNIAQIHGLEESSAVRALVLEFVEGPALADRIARGSLPQEDALEIARQIALALEAAHDCGIVHRDLKPANVKIRDDGMVKVLDFGLAKAMEQPSGPGADDRADTDEPGLGVILGTAAYMSPEQARGKPVDQRADVWAFGCVMYEMLSGRPAFDADDVSSTLAAILKGTPDASAVCGRGSGLGTGLMLPPDGANASYRPDRYASYEQDAGQELQHRHETPAREAGKDEPDRNPLGGRHRHSRPDHQRDERDTAEGPHARDYRAHSVPAFVPPVR